jgi:hypothetical protein
MYFHLTNIHITNVGVEQILLRVHTRETSGSNLGSERAYPDRFFVIFLSLSRQIPGQCLNEATTAFIN